MATNLRRGVMAALREAERRGPQQVWHVARLHNPHGRSFTVKSYETIEAKGPVSYASEAVGSWHGGTRCRWPGARNVIHWGSWGVWDDRKRGLTFVVARTGEQLDLLLQEQRESILRNARADVYLGEQSRRREAWTRALKAEWHAAGKPCSWDDHWSEAWESRRMFTGKRSRFSMGREFRREPT